MKSIWPTKKLGEVCNIVYGYAFKAGDFNETGNGLPVIRIGDVDNNKTGKFFDGKYNDKYLVKKGDILLGLSGSFKAFRWEGDTALLNQRVATLRSFENDIVESFVFYQMPKLFAQFEKTITQLSVKNILTKHLENLKILCPPLKTQKQIVERLDKIAEAQKLNDELIQKADGLFQSLLHKELNIANKNWPLNDIGDMINFSQLGLVRSKDKQNDSFEFNYIKMDNISPTGDLLLNKLVKVNATPQEVQKFKLEGGDFIFNTRNTPELVGKSTIFDIKNSGIFLFNNNILRLHFKNELLAEFLNYYLHTEYGIKKLNSKKRGTTSVSAIYQGDLFSIRVPIPSLEIQKQIVEKLSAAQEYKKQLLEQKLKLKEFFDSVLHRSMNFQG